MGAHLSPTQIASIQHTLSRVRLGQDLTVIHGDSFGAVAHKAVSVVAQSQRVSSKGQSSKVNKIETTQALYTNYVDKYIITSQWRKSE